MSICLSLTAIQQMCNWNETAMRPCVSWLVYQLLSKPWPSGCRIDCGTCCRWPQHISYFSCNDSFASSLQYSFRDVSSVLFLSVFSWNLAFACPLWIPYCCLSSAIPLRCDTLAARSNDWLARPSVLLLMPLSVGALAPTEHTGSALQSTRPKVCESCVDM